MFGGGRGRRQWNRPYTPPAAPPISPAQELAWLQEQSQMMQAQLADIQSRIDNLTAENTEK
jgi:hypothetical protein